MLEYTCLPSYTTLLLGVQWIVHPVLNEVSNFELTNEFARTATKIVSYKTFRTHRRLYYNDDTKRWYRDGQSSQDLDRSVAGSGCYGAEGVDDESPPEDSENDGSHLPYLLSPREESPPLSEPGSVSSSVSSPTTDGKQTTSS